MLSVQEFERAVEVERTTIINMLIRAGVRPDDAEDAYQEATLAAYQKLDTYRGNSTVRTWLYGFAENIAKRIATAEREETAACRELARQPSDGPTPVGMKIKLAKLLAPLDRGLREALLRVYGQGESWAEVAKEMGVPAATLRQRGSRAMRRLREQALSHPDDSRVKEAVPAA